MSKPDIKIIKPQRAEFTQSGFTKYADLVVGDRRIGECAIRSGDSAIVCDAQSEVYRNAIIAKDDDDLRAQVPAWLEAEQRIIARRNSADQRADKE